MSKKFTRVVCVILALLMVFGLVSFVLGPNAFAVTQSEIDALQSQRDALKEKQENIAEQIESLESEMTFVLDKKAALDEQNELNRQDIELINEQIELYKEMIIEKAIELRDAIAEEKTQYENYRTRVRAMEERNSWSYVSMLFDADSLTDFLSRLNDVLDIVRNDQNLKAEYEAARIAVQTAKAEYEETQEQQKEKRTELLEEKAQLEKQINEACKLMTDLEEDIEEYKSAYEANEELENDIQSKIDQKVKELQAQKAAEEAARKAYLAAQQSKPTYSGGGSASSGYFSWPVPSCTYITSKFGYRVHPIFGTTKYHAGVDIAASSGATIQAAAGGTVSIAEYSDSYGYYCVIYHSNGTTTLYAHMNAQPCVSVGDTVSKGQVIGYVGSTGWSTGPHCHFEIRVNGSCVDPLSYFAGTSFSFATDA